MLSVAQAVHHPETPGSASKHSALGHSWSSDRPNVLKRRKTDSDCFITDKKIAISPMKSPTKHYTINSETTLIALPKSNSKVVRELSKDKIKTFSPTCKSEAPFSNEAEEKNNLQQISTNIPRDIISFLENSQELQLTKRGSNENVKLINRNEFNKDYIDTEKLEQESCNNFNGSPAVELKEVTIEPCSSFSKSKDTKLPSIKKPGKIQSKLDEAMQKLKEKEPINKAFNSLDSNKTFNSKAQIHADIDTNFDIHDKYEEPISRDNLNVITYVRPNSPFDEEPDNHAPASSVCDYEQFNVGISCDKFYSNNRDKPHYTTGFPNPPGENRCWTNATLQALFALPVVNKLDIFEVPDCSKLMISLINIQSHWQKGKTGNHNFEQIFTSFKEEISELDKLYSSKAQQDVSEFILNLLNFIKTEFATNLMKGSHDNEIENIPNNEQDTCRKTQNNTYDSNRRLPLTDISKQSKNNNLNSKTNSLTEKSNNDVQNQVTANLIDEYYSLYMVENYVCEGCSKQRPQKVENLMLFIDLPAEDHNSTVNLVDMINKTYALEHRNMTCESCKHDMHSMETKFRKLPKILTVQVKRYEMTSNGTIMKKCNLVEIPKLLKLDTLIINNSQEFSQSPEYEPIGIISHIGDNIDSGHYISFVKHQNQWFYYDDMNVKMLSDDEVFKCVQNNAYVIFFQDTNIDISIDTTIDQNNKEEDITN